MSYVRWGEYGSDLYIYPDAGGGITCCGCNRIPEGHSYNASCTELMVRHVRDHIALGDSVPSWLIDALEANPVTVNEGEHRA